MGMESGTRSSGVQCIVEDLCRMPLKTKMMDFRNSESKITQKGQIIVCISWVAKCWNFIALKTIFCSNFVSNIRSLMSLPICEVRNRM